VNESTKTAIITAMLTGIFTIAAGIATFWFTTKEPELAYSVVGGPALSSALGTKRIFVVEVRNTGKKEVGQTLVQIALKSGELSEVASEASPGVKLVEEKTLHLTDIRADLMNPGDAVKVSFLASLTPPGSDPTVVVRAPGVKAVAESSKRDHPFNLTEPEGLLSLLAPALAAVLTSFVLLSRTGLIEKLGLPTIGSSLDQSELCAYVCEACGLHDEADRVRFGGGEISYRGVADFLRHRAERLGIADRVRHETAMRALLLVSSMARGSSRAIRAGIDAIALAPLTDIEFEETKRQAFNEGTDPTVWRERINSFVHTRGL
jgi:hypothetical protein